MTTVTDERRHARGRALRRRGGAAGAARGRHDHALLARRALRGARARRTPRRALRPARLRRVDHRRPRGARRTRCATSPPTPRPSPADSTTGRRTWRASASAGWSPRSPRSTTRTRSRRSPSPGRDPSPPARSTTTCPTMTRRRWSRLFSRADARLVRPRRRGGVRRRRRGDPRRRSRRRTRDRRARSGTARRAPSPPSRWPTSWAWCSPSSTATPRWRERLPELALPTLVVHGRRDPFFPVGNGEALAREIPGARLLVLERAATAIPGAAAGEVAAAMLAL